MIRTTIIAAVAACTFFAAAPAQAATDPFQDRPTRVVRIADLDLSQTADQDKLRTRVERAARNICRTEYTRYERRKCMAETIEYTMSVVPQGVRRAYAAASDRQASFALAQN